jgi:hypothetical protein
MKNKTMTAVEWLVEKLNQCEPMYSGIKSNEHKEHLEKLVQQSKEIEKEQIIDAFKEGNLYHGWALKHEPEQYYNETYKKEEK